MTQQASGAAGGTGWEREQEGSVAGPDLLRILDTAVNPFALIDTSGTVLWAGSSIDELLGVDAQALVGRSMLEFLAPSSIDEALRALAAADDYMRARRGVPDRWEGAGPLLDLVRSDGTVITCAIAVATPARTGLPGYAVQLRRATSAGALERTIASMASGEPLAAVLDNLSSVVSGDLPDTDVLIGYEPRGDRLSEGVEHVAGGGPEGLRSALRHRSESATPWEMAEDSPGEVVEVPTAELPPALRAVAELEGASSCAALAVVTDPAAQPTGLIVAWRRHGLPLHVFSTDRLRRGGHLVGLALQWDRGRRALEWAASHDSLTGLRNRQAFLACLDGETKHRRAPGSAVLYLDLDDFKPLNDEHGHALGDRVLAEVAARLRRSVRPTDVVARLGGDEFAVLCPGLDEPEQLDQVAARLVEEVSRPLDLGGVDVTVGLSVGIAGIVGGQGGPDEVLSRADEALRRAKSEGKRRWRYAEPSLT